MEFVLRRKLDCFGSSRGNITPYITVAFLLGEEFLKWKKENGKWKILCRSKDYSGEGIWSISTKTPFNLSMEGEFILKGGSP